MSGAEGRAPVPDWELLRGRLREARGREYWRSLEELADSPEFREILHREFPREAASLDGAVSRREFVTLLGAMLAVTGLAGCGKPPAEKILPYVRQPEGIVPGKPLYYATAMPFSGGATGLLARSDMGRPTKLEGNPRHPASLGATDPFAQAEIYTFWDPDRSQSVLNAGVPSTWASFQTALSAAMATPKANHGRGLRILTESLLSPTLADQLDSLLRSFPEARGHSFDPVGRDFVRAGSLLSFGMDVEPIYRLDKARVVFSLDADFLSCAPGRERYSRDFAEGRRRGARLYVAEAMPSTTGSMADHRWPVRAAAIDGVARDLAAALGLLPRPASERTRWDWVSAVARDLRRYAGESLVLAGPGQPASVHALAAAINEGLGNVGKTVDYIDSPTFRPADGRESLATLAAEMAAGKVDVLLILGGNPVYSAPADLDFTRSLSRVRFRAHLSLYEDETSWQCHWHLPEAHFLESWGDALAFDGTASIIQPVIAPLYDGKTAHDVVSGVAGESGRSTYDLVREYWRRRRGPTGFEAFWQTALHDGIVAGTARAPRKIAARLEEIRRALPPPNAAESLEIVFKPDPTVWDGRFANNPWLQELPKPITTLTWDNAAMIAPAFAQRRGIANGDLLAISQEGRTVRAPAWIVPGHADESITLHLGYGRARVGRVGNGRGFNAFLLRSREAVGSASGARIEKTGEKVRLATTQTHHSMEGRDPVRVTTANRLSRDPNAIQTPEDRDRRSLYPEVPSGEYAWGMVIDLNTCTGCNACVVACQVENNVPVVGKDEVLRGREMHWLRVDTYQEGHPDHPHRVHQPVPCMHCEKAPCEIVCPTVATAHSSEGLNQMIYNRCVGTRYCQNNCPYKVRRFNFFRYADFETPQLQQSYNPDVTVRERGVMEKCTYCVQRIVQVRIGAEKEGRRIRDGEVRTACQQACPNGAIVFGDLGQRDSQVSRLRSSPLNYELLGELNTRPRTTYLARIRNPNPELEGS